MNSGVTIMLFTTTLIFVVFKFTGVLAWSWWWVLAPLWLPVALSLAFLSAAAIADWVRYERERGGLW